MVNLVFLTVLSIGIIGCLATVIFLLLERRLTQYCALCQKNLDYINRLETLNKLTQEAQENDMGY